MWDWIRKDRIWVWKRKENSCVGFTNSIRQAREIRTFQVADLQRRLRNVQKKSVMHVQSCCFANVNRLVFCRSRCRRRRCCLSDPLLWSRMLLPCCSFHTPNLKSNFMIFWREYLILKEKLHLPIIFAPSGRMMRRQRGTRTSPVESFVSWLSYR